MTGIFKASFIFLIVIPLFLAGQNKPAKTNAPSKKVITQTKPLPAFKSPETVYVKGGFFLMGSDSAAAAERPAHKVFLANFNISKYEISVAEFRKFIQASHYQTTAEIKGTSFIWNAANLMEQKNVNWACDAYGFKTSSAADKQPVIHISWEDANAYCAWLSKQTGQRWRLPTAAEWEYAAKGGSTSKGLLFSGSSDISEVAWYDGNSDNRIHNIGLKKPNELGLYDMSGNVWELCSDWYQQGYVADSILKNPKGPDTGIYHALKGGSWYKDPTFAFPYSRSKALPEQRASDIGFRVVRE